MISAYLVGWGLVVASADVLGTSNCKPRSNFFMWLIIIYLGFGILLIVVLIAFNIDVANGTVNGIILC